MSDTMEHASLSDLLDDRTGPEPPAKPRRRRRFGLMVGLALVGIGLGLLAYVGWELFATDIVAKGRYEENATALTKAWDRGGNTATTQWGTVTAFVEVPRWGKDYRKPILEGTTATQLNAGVGHYEDAVDPGRIGNYAIAGHRTTYGKPFAAFPELQVGDEVKIITRTKTYIYQLINDGDSITINPTNTWVADVIPHNPTPGGIEPPQKKGQRLLTMSTCSGVFGWDARKVVWGELDRIVNNDGDVIRTFKHPTSVVTAKATA